MGEKYIRPKQGLSQHRSPQTLLTSKQVEGEAQSASQQDLDAFENHVEKHMPGAAKVDKYYSKKIPAVQGETGFKKRY